ncbi:DUF1479-domain-containing protein [Ramaria rubella]|nr:DUF1479-domain-containing protein [Ramaria rubella]
MFKTQTPPRDSKAPGTIASLFDSLTGAEVTPLPQRFADLKRKLVPTPEAERALERGWERLLDELMVMNNVWADKGTENIPCIAYEELVGSDNASVAAQAVRACGTVVVKRVVDENVAVGWMEGIRDYVKKNPGVKGFPEHDPQVYELYWSPSQIAARSHPRMLNLLARLNTLYTASLSTSISLIHPILYADRCRSRHPGDTSFSLGPHADSGTLERWEDETYSSVYKNIVLEGWEKWDPWSVDGRVKAKTDIYDAPGGCSVLRTFQGWLSLSSTGPGEGTLRVHPSIKHATTYFWMRPFFAPVKPLTAFHSKDLDNSGFLSPSNWRLDLDSTTFPGSPIGRGQEFSDATHPHLELGRVMTSVPRVEPGDCVFWHCDSIHAVESTHSGTVPSSVMYIPSAPLTAQNAIYMARQRDAFVRGVPPPDFPGGAGESEFVGRAGVKHLEGEGGRAGMGFKGFTGAEKESAVVQEAHRILGVA